METTSPSSSPPGSPAPGMSPRLPPTSPGLALSFYGHVGHLVLLILPWMHIQCRMDRDTIIEARRSGIQIAFNQPPPQFYDLPPNPIWGTNARPSLDWHLIFLVVPVLGLLGAAVKMRDRKSWQQVATLLAVGAIGLLIARGYLGYEVTSEASRIRAELDLAPEVVRITWLWPFWGSLVADLVVLGGALSVEQNSRPPPA